MKKIALSIILGLFVTSVPAFAKNYMEGTGVITAGYLSVEGSEGFDKVCSLYREGSEGI
jgi:hypothetical protein